jgi:hypothetical protein
LDGEDRVPRRASVLPVLNLRVLPSCILRVKIKLSLCFIRHYIKKTYVQAEQQLYAFLILLLDRDEWSVSRPGRFALEDRARGTDWIGGWVDLTAGLDDVKEGQIFCPCRKLKPDSSS